MSHAETAVMSRLWVLGAPDPEMAAIEALLLECGERFVHARDAAGARVTPGNAYRAACPTELTGGFGEALSVVYRVECHWDWSEESLNCRVVSLDHHHPGDYGYGARPRDFLGASSLGQVIAELFDFKALPSWPHKVFEFSPFALSSEWLVSERRGRRLAVPRSLVLTAAADHCLGAAYRGECPGVEPEALMRFRAEERARFQGRSVDAVLADIAETTLALMRQDIRRLELAGYEHAEHTTDHDWQKSVCSGCSDYPLVVADMRTCPVCDGRGALTGNPDATAPCHHGPRGPWPELVETATRTNRPYVSGPLRVPDGRAKYTCSGSARIITAFFEWAEREGLVDAYGDPARGFAGAYARANAAEKRSP